MLQPRCRAFSLIELLLVLAVIATCFGLVLPALQSWLRHGQEARLVHAIRQSLFQSRELAILAGTETRWPATPEIMPPARIALSTPEDVRFLPDGTAQQDVRVEVYNAQDQLIETLVVVAATGGVLVEGDLP